MRVSGAGIAQLVEHDLAKVGVASSSLVSRSTFSQDLGSPRFCFFSGAWWQSGYAADCKSAYAGSIPTQASTEPRTARFFLLDAGTYDRRMPGW